MGKIEEYQTYIQKLIMEISQLGSSSATEVERQTIFDTDRHHYQLFYVGWYNNRRVYGCVLHFDIKNEKIWIQHNGTEMSIADELVALGVPKQDIVLGFHSPIKRKFTEFAVG